MATSYYIFARFLFQEGQIDRKQLKKYWRFDKRVSRWNEKIECPCCGGSGKQPLPLLAPSIKHCGLCYGAGYTFKLNVQVLASCQNNDKNL
jgi:hypothetical protein